MPTHFVKFILNLHLRQVPTPQAMNTAKEDEVVPTPRLGTPTSLPIGINLIASPLKTFM